MKNEFIDYEAVRIMEERISKWRPSLCDRKDQSIVKMYTEDRRGLRKVLSLYKKGKLAAAFEAASSLDTIVRDEIPCAIWDAINK